MTLTGYADLNDEGRRTIGHIFFDGRIPLRTIYLTPANIGGCQDGYYMIDWLRMTEWQREAMREFMIERDIHVDEFDECLRIFDLCVPIRTDYVSCVTQDKTDGYN